MERLPSLGRLEESCTLFLMEIKISAGSLARQT